jgi:hypothetical protein
MHRAYSYKVPGQPASMASKDPSIELLMKKQRVLRYLKESTETLPPSCRIGRTRHGEILARAILLA